MKYIFFLKHNYNMAATDFKTAGIVRYDQAVLVVISGKFTGMYLDPISPPDKRRVIGYGDVGERLNLKMHRRIKDQFPEFTFSEDVLPIEFGSSNTYWKTYGVVEHGEHYKFTAGDVANVIFSVKKVVIGYNEIGGSLTNEVLETIVENLPDFTIDAAVLPRIEEPVTIITQDFDVKKKLRYVSEGPAPIIGLVFSFENGVVAVGMGPQCLHLNLREAICAVKNGFEVPRDLRNWVLPFDLSDPLDSERKTFKVISGPIQGLMVKKIGDWYKALGMYQSCEPLTDDVKNIIKEHYPTVFV